MIIAITPTGARPEAFAQCERLMARQTRKPDLWLIIDDCDPQTKCTMGQHCIWPEPKWPNFAQRNTQHRNIIAALDYLKSIEWDKDLSLIFFEDDDWYDELYIETQMVRLYDAELVGEAPARYYHVRHGAYRIFDDTPHASLCATAMRASLIPELRAICETGAWIDVELWRRCRDRGMLFPGTNVVGIKGMPGRPGVSEIHRHGLDRRFTPDTDGAVLREWTGIDAPFYAKFRTKPIAERPKPAEKVWDEDLQLWRIKREGRPDRFRCPDCTFDHFDAGPVMEHWMQTHAPEQAPELEIFKDATPVDRKIIVPSKSDY